VTSLKMLSFGAVGDALSSATPMKTHAVARDYYMSGVKIDQSHFGCIYNIGCCHFFVGEYANAKKWFSLAIKVRR